MLPAEVREAAGINAGDIVEFKVVGPGKIELTTHSPMSIDAFLAQYGPGEPIADWHAFIEEAEAELGDELVRRIRDGLE